MTGWWRVSCGPHWDVLVEAQSVFGAFCAATVAWLPGSPGEWWATPVPLGEVDRSLAGRLVAHP